MSNYDPAILADKWPRSLRPLLAECQQRWASGRPKRKWWSFRDPEADLSQDRRSPRADRLLLSYDGHVTLGHFARAFFPAYIPGDQTHYGSVVYASDPTSCDEVFDLAWRVNELRRDHSRPPAGTEIVAQAIRDDTSDFARIEMPSALGVGTGRYFANICIHRSRLPLRYLHSRLVPILIHHSATPWCSLLPLRFWSPQMIEIWESGSPAYPAEEYAAHCRKFGIRP